MKEQSRIEFHTRRSRISNSETVKVKSIEDDKQLTKAFRPVEHVVTKPNKVEKLVARKSSRLASKNLTQTVLDLKKIDKPVAEEHTAKRKIEATSKAVNKKQKQHHDVDSEIDNNTHITETVVETKATESTTKEVTISKNTESNKEGDLNKEAEIVNSKEEEADLVQTPNTTTTISPVLETQDNNNEQEEDKVQDFAVESFKSTIENTPLAHIQEEEEEYALASQDTLSPPSSFVEPMTPPPQTRETYDAPYKEYLTEADKQRIDYEKSTLEKLRKSLDIVITDRAARHQPTLYHQIESVLRNSTRRTITLSHICKIMYIAPELYTLEAKELRNFGGKVTEAFLIQFTKDWSIPLVGKDLQKRADILHGAITQYFVDHPGPDASIPEKTLPRLNLVVDKKEWLKDAQLPSGVRKLLQAHEKAKEAEIEREKPKPKPTGSVKDRMAALRARLAKKSA